MNIKYILLSAMLLLLLLLPLPSHADSPVTSTPFYEAYMDVGIVEKAHESGVMTFTIARYLATSWYPIDKKMAVINALSWDFDGKSNAELFEYYLGLKYGVTRDQLLYDELDPDELLCLGYLLIMDDYFVPDEGVFYLEMANERVDDSFTYAIILAIGKAQLAMDYDWSEIWPLTEAVLENKDLKQDMREDAVRIIREYMELYK